MRTVKFTEQEVSVLGGKSELASITPAEFRDMVRRDEWRRPDIMACYGYAKFNLVIIPNDLAFEFLLFAQRNPRHCAIQDVTEPGDVHPKLLAPKADLRTDLPKYRVFKEGKLIDEPTDIIKYWRDDLVAFLIGASPNFDYALEQANIQYRLVGAYSTNIPSIPAGRFHGNVVVTGRLFKSSFDAIRAIQISSRHEAGHGPPIHIGKPELIGIQDLSHTDIISVDKTPQQPGEIAMFWGCGATPQLVAMASKVPFLISHCVGHMFISDKRIEELAIF